MQPDTIGQPAFGRFEAAAWRQQYIGSLSLTEQRCYLYLETRARIGRTYVSIGLMARQLQLTDDQCDNALVRFRVERSLPRFAVLEEAEG